MNTTEYSPPLSPIQSASTSIKLEGWDFNEMNVPTTAQLRAQCDDSIKNLRGERSVSEINEITTLFLNTLRLYESIGVDFSTTNFRLDNKPFNKKMLKLRITQQMKAFLQCVNKSNSNERFQKLLGPYHNQRVLLSEIKDLIHDVDDRNFKKKSLEEAQNNASELMREVEKNYRAMISINSEADVAQPPLEKRVSSSRRSGRRGSKEGDCIPLEGKVEQVEGKVEQEALKAISGMVPYTM